MVIEKVIAAKAVRESIAEAIRGSDLLKGLSVGTDTIDFAVYDQMRDKLTAPYIFLLYRGGTPIDKFIGDGYMMQFKYDIVVSMSSETYLNDEVNDVLLVGEDMVSYVESAIVDIMSMDDIVPEDYITIRKDCSGISESVYPVESGQKAYSFIIPIALTVKIFGGK